MLAEDIRLQLSQYIQEPLVSVIVNEFAGTFSQQVRVVGATEKPASLPYRANMTLLDAMIAVGGLSEFAAGNRAKLIRFDKATGSQREYALRLGDLLKKGDSQANVMLDAGRRDHHPREHVLRRARAHERRPRRAARGAVDRLEPPLAGAGGGLGRVPARLAGRSR